MKKLLASVVLLVPTMVFAQSPFDGTWKTNLDQTKFSSKPIVFSLKDGTYDCSSCAPKIHVKADGSDQPVTGQAYDTIAVKDVDLHTIQVVAKKNGRSSWEQTRVASEDGKLDVKTTSHPPDSDQVITTESTLERLGKAEPGANATSGSWKLLKASESENGLLATFKGSGTEMSMSDPTGWSWTAKFDGKDNPVKGSDGVDSVSLKQLNDHTIEASYKRGGKLIVVEKMTVSSDGKTMTTVSDSKLTGRVSTYVASKQ